MSSERLVIVDGVRTPFAKMGTAFADIGAEELGRLAVSGLLTRTGLDPETVDEVIFGCVAQPADAANVARVIALKAGIPERVPAFTVHRNCASGCEAITQAFEKISAGRGEVFIVGGTENMSRVPLLYRERAKAKFMRLSRAKSFGQKLGTFLSFRPSDFLDPVVGLRLGLEDPVSGLNMGQTAELIGREAGVTRRMQDAFSAASHLRALAARERLAEEIIPVHLDPARRKIIDEDNGPRDDATPERLARLRTVFEKKTGTVTAGNSSQITDGAVALLVMSESRAQKEGRECLGVLEGYAYAGCDPARMGLGPVHAIHEAEKRTGLAIGDADLVEINEAFAAQVLAVIESAKSAEYCSQHLGRSAPLGEIDPNKLNVNGGAIALGHPVGVTGARLVLTSLKELGRRGGGRALVTLCVGGGQGAALWLKGA